MKICILSAHKCPVVMLSAGLYKSKLSMKTQQHAWNSQGICRDAAQYILLQQGPSTRIFCALQSDTAQGTDWSPQGEQVCTHTDTLAIHADTLAHTHKDTYSLILTIYIKTHITQTHSHRHTHREVQSPINKDTPWDIHTHTYTKAPTHTTFTQTHTHLFTYTQTDIHTLICTQTHKCHRYTHSHIHINRHTHTSLHTGWGITILEKKSQFF